MAVSESMSGAGNEVVDFAEALVLVGNKPQISEREDIIFQADTIAGRWAWSEDVGKGLSEAIAFHKKAGDAVMIVADESSQNALWKRNIGTGIAAPGSDVSTATEKAPEIQSLEVHGQDLQVQLTRPDEEIPKPIIPESSGEEVTESQKWQSKSQGAPIEKAAAPEGPVQTISTTGTTVQSQPGMVQFSWLDDYTTASLALCAILMFAPDVVSLLIAFNTFLPVVFFVTQLGFVGATIAAYASRGDRKPRLIRSIKS